MSELARVATATLNIYISATITPGRKENLRGVEGKIKGQAGVCSVYVCVCAHFCTLVGQLIRVGLICGSCIPVSTRVA